MVPGWVRTLERINRTGVAEVMRMEHRRLAAMGPHIPEQEAAMLLAEIHKELEGVVGTEKEGAGIRNELVAEERLKGEARSGRVEVEKVEGGSVVEARHNGRRALVVAVKVAAETGVVERHSDRLELVGVAKAKAKAEAEKVAEESYSNRLAMAMAMAVEVKLVVVPHTAVAAAAAAVLCTEVGEAEAAGSTLGEEASWVEAEEIGHSKRVVMALEVAARDRLAEAEKEVAGKVAAARDTLAEVAAAAEVVKEEAAKVAAVMEVVGKVGAATEKVEVEMAGAETHSVPEASKQAVEASTQGVAVTLQVEAVAGSTLAAAEGVGREAAGEVMQARTERT
ncbi:hypothetical protein Taro_020012 [Colocasia esculenta]|uniref:Uncharacterized protein n=1 Tax=Colocasia esculenta TaxID=4460 RepID=A0A843UVA5_COLES|nr:hypothetical protein [Colocasia esculenta]